MIRRGKQTGDGQFSTCFVAIMLFMWIKKATWLMMKKLGELKKWMDYTHRSHDHMFTVLGFSGFTMNYPQKLELFAGDQATQIHLTMNEQMLGAWVTLGVQPRNRKWVSDEGKNIWHILVWLSGTWQLRCTLTQIDAL
jgi:hypothetical protein